MFRISQAIRRTKTPDGGILLDVQHGQIFSLNSVGAKIVELLERGHDEARIASEISRDYGANQELVRADVAQFIEVLRKHHILQTVHPANVA